MTPRKRHETEDVAELLHEPADALGPADAAVKADETEGPDLPNIPLLDASPANVAEMKPTWRGWIHAGTFPVAVAAGIVLITLAHGAPAKWASAVFMLTSMLLFGNSALYHRFNWKP
ncbi:hemolysin III family protein, partial [Kitasatospora herbaricolor]|uniref:hemolysin III family protein n=1 Tax=Kitasatospora herbaricolor TaxID=68217 RepID=UPI0036DF2A8A